MTILIVALIMFPVLITHELGHLLMARCFGVKADAFVLGFGKKALFTFNKGEGRTRIEIRPLPIGGACVFDDKEKGGLNNLPPAKRMLVYLAGPLVNFIETFLFAFLAAVSAAASTGANLIETAGRFIANQFSLIGSFFVNLAKMFVPSYYLTLMDTRKADAYFMTAPGSQLMTVVLLLTASVTFLLFIGNLLPIPALDGGQIMMTAPELFGKKLNQKSVEKINTLCISIITILSVTMLIEMGIGYVYNLIIHA